MEHRIFENEKELSNIIKKPIKYLSLFFILTFIPILIIYVPCYIIINNFGISISLFWFLIMVLISIPINLGIFYTISLILTFFTLKLNDKKVKKFNELNDQKLETYKTIMSNLNISKSVCRNILKGYFKYHFSRETVFWISFNVSLLMWIATGTLTPGNSIILMILFGISPILYLIKNQKVNYK